MRENPRPYSPKLVEEGSASRKFTVVEAQMLQYTRYVAQEVGEGDQTMRDGRREPRRGGEAAMYYIIGILVIILLVVLILQFV